MGGGGGDYVFLVVPYTPLGGSGGRKFLVLLCSETAFSTI